MAPIPAAVLAFLGREASWRNVMIWIGVWALFYEIMLRKIIDWLLPILGVSAAPLPDISADLWEIVAAILGGGGLSLLARYTDTVISRPPAQVEINAPLESIAEAVAQVDEKVRLRRTRVRNDG